MFAGDAGTGTKTDSVPMADGLQRTASWWMSCMVPNAYTVRFESLFSVA
jgi:hypothetical protein